MEMLSEALIVAALSSPISRAERAAAEHPQDLSQNDETETKEANLHQIRSDVAIAEGWGMRSEPSEPKTCQFCGKTLYHYGLKDFIRKKEIFLWFDEPEHCDCEQAQAYWAERRSFA